MAVSDALARQVGQVSAQSLQGKPASLESRVTVPLCTLSAFAPFSRMPQRRHLAKPPISRPATNGPYLASTFPINDMAFCF